MIIRPYKTTSSCEITCDVSKCFLLLSALPGKKKWIDRILVFQPIGASIKYILDNWPDAEWIDGAEQYVETWTELKMKEQNTRAEKHELLEDESGYEYKTIPFAHQKQAFILGREHKGFAWFHEQGCGKSKVAIDTFAYLWERDIVDCLLIVAPNGVHSNWIINEVPEHLPERLPARLHTFSNHMNKEDGFDLDWDSRTKPKNRKCLVIAFNVEGFVSDKAKKVFDQFLTTHRCMIAVDESNCIQNHKAQRTKYILKAGKKATYKCILNGTPITRGIENLYSQFAFLDPLILGHQNFYTYRAQYCIMGGFESKSIIGYQHIKELIEAVDGNSHRVLKKDCLDLPDKIYKKHFFQMTPAQKTAYSAVRSQALEELEKLFGKEHGRELAKELAITKMIRLQQIVCGWIPHRAEEEAVPLAGGNPRLDALLTLLENTDQKAIIWVNATSSRADIKLIASHLERGKLGGFVEYHGGIKSEKREQAIYEFQNNQKIKWFLASKAAAMGLTLTAAGEAFYYTNNFDLRIRLQSEDRNHRIGSEIHDKIVYTDIFTTGIDKKIVTTLKNRKSIADQVNQDPISVFMEET